MPSHGGPRRDAGPQGPSARRGLRARAARGLAAGGLALLAALVAGAPAWADGGRTIVTLEFDVATADQALALPLLAKHHMHGTFFVNSGFVNQPGHLTWDELRHMQAVGHEIAGQTIDHARLTRLGPAGIEHEVCDDRGRLLAQGLAVDAFAYPFGAFNRRAKRIVMACGYSSARLASGIRGGEQACVSCPYAESIPPRNRFATRMPAATRRTTKIARIIRAVAHAEAAGGGWVQILIHHVCHGCHRYAIAPEGLAGLLRWLDREPGVEVRTVSQIMDTRGPAIAITPPSGRWAVGDRMTIPVRIRAPAGVRRIRYFVDGHQIGVRSLAPRRLRWYSGGVSPGRHTVRALLEDERGNAAISSQRTFTRVNPGQTPPR